MLITRSFHYKFFNNDYEGLEDKHIDIDAITDAMKRMVEGFNSNENYNKKYTKNNERSMVKERSNNRTVVIIL